MKNLFFVVLTLVALLTLTTTSFAATAVRPPQPNLTAQQKYNCARFEAYGGVHYAELRNFFDSSDDKPAYCDNHDTVTETLEVGE